MRAYRVELLPAAEQDLRKVTIEVRRLVVARMADLARGPRGPGTRRLSGADDLCRARAGDHRIPYRIADGALLVLVVRVGHRRDVGPRR